MSEPAPADRPAFTTGDATDTGPTGLPVTRLRLFLAELLRAMGAWPT